MNTAIKIFVGACVVFLLLPVLALPLRAERMYYMIKDHDVIIHNNTWAGKTITMKYHVPFTDEQKNKSGVTTFHGKGVVFGQGNYVYNLKMQKLAIASEPSISGTEQLTDERIVNGKHYSVIVEWDSPWTVTRVSIADMHVDSNSPPTEPDPEVEKELLSVVDDVIATETDPSKRQQLIEHRQDLVDRAGKPIENYIPGEYKNLSARLFGFLF